MISDTGGRRPTPDRQTNPAGPDPRHSEPIDSKLTPQAIFDLTEAALKKGGSFEIALAKAIREGDPTNQRLILEQFPRLIDKYGPDGWCK